MKELADANIGLMNVKNMTAKIAATEKPCVVP